MSSCRKLAAGAALSVAFSSVARAQSTTQSVSYEVQAISRLSTSGAASLTINTAVAGSQPTQATAHTTYAITTNETSRKITIQINTAMPTDVTLTATLAAPAASGTSAGAVTLTTTAQDAVNAITQVADSGLALDYTLDALVTAGVVPQASKTVTLTIVAGP